MITLPELKEFLAKTYDECTLIQLLEVNSDEIVNAFTDQIEERFDSLVEEMDELEYEDREDYN